MVTIKDVSKSYAVETKALEQVSLELKQGEFVYLVGGTGAGKSTLLRMIATEDSPTSGRVSLFGYSLATASPGTLRSIRRSLGYVPQDLRLIPDLTVYENVALSVSLGKRRFVSKDAKKSILDLLERLGLITKKDQFAQSLSGGEAQRVAVARALARSPVLLVADEPTGAQDRESTWSMMDLFLKANMNGTTVVIATHDREIVRRVKKRCVMLKGGRLFSEEPVCIY